MVGKKVEGNEDQRRAAAREARREGTTPSALKETTGASKQPGHHGRHEPHEEKVASIHQGKQSWEETVPDPRRPTMARSSTSADAAAPITPRSTPGCSRP